MIHIIKFILIIIIYVISAILAIPILICRIAYIMSCIMLDDIQKLSRNDYDTNDDENNSENKN